MGIAILMNTMSNLVIVIAKLIMPLIVSVHAISRFLVSSQHACACMMTTYLSQRQKLMRQAAQRHSQLHQSPLQKGLLLQQAHSMGLGFRVSMAHMLCISNIFAAAACTEYGSRLQDLHSLHDVLHIPNRFAAATGLRKQLQSATWSHSSECMFPSYLVLGVALLCDWAASSNCFGEQRLVTLQTSSKFASHTVVRLLQNLT